MAILEYHLQRQYDWIIDSFAEINKCACGGGRLTGSTTVLIREQQPTRDNPGMINGSERRRC